MAYLSIFMLNRSMAKWTAPSETLKHQTKVLTSATQSHIETLAKAKQEPEASARDNIQDICRDSKDHRGTEIFLCSWEGRW